MFFKLKLCGLFTILRKARTLSLLLKVHFLIFVTSPHFLFLEKVSGRKRLQLRRCASCPFLNGLLLICKLACFVIICCISSVISVISFLHDLAFYWIT